MVSLKLRKRLAASVLKCGKPCWIHSDEGFSALVNWPEKANWLHGKGREREGERGPMVSQRLLKLQKRLTASVLKCGRGKVWLDPNEANKISMATLDSGPAAAVAPAPQASGGAKKAKRGAKKAKKAVMFNSFVARISKLYKFQLLDLVK
ncbi:hypothetical protein RHGRI_012622 [Rhododendron griersonianum]|uniref:Ribosomal protein L19 n=1 Tax=Rhododendron griersonianum TaxID=479676 RepID=A0AAV6KSF6_9ERIC|nr:hypothetical protein RHGRI_012622 [Rhododendron griersonianum]